LPVGEAPARIAQQPLSDPEASDEREAVVDERTEVDDAGAPAGAAAVARPVSESQDQEGESGRRRRRRGRRGGRRRRRGGERPVDSVVADEPGVAAASGDESENANGEGWAGEDESWVADDSAPADASPEHAAEPPAHHDQPWPLQDDRLGSVSAGNGNHDDGPRPEPADDLRTGAATDRPEAVSGGTPPLHGNADFNGNGSSPATPQADAEAEADAESSGQQPAGPARRGWWKRLIE
jgi:ribonuclease E